MKPIINIDIEQKLKELNREDLLFHSSPATDNFLYEFVSKKKPTNIIEIGTYNGLSTVQLASIVDGLVYTFDIIYRNCEYMWNLFGVRHKIDNFIGTKEDIHYNINWRWNRKQILFDFAFIDGDHRYKSVKWDFELVKRCGRVLFHDINGEEVGRFVKEIGGKQVHEIFGYWEAKNDN